MFALKAEHISQGKNFCSLSSFIFIVYFFFLNKLTAPRVDCGIMAIRDNPVMSVCALDGLCWARLTLHKTSGCSRELLTAHGEVKSLLSMTSICS